VEKARLFFTAAEIVRRRGPQVAGILARETGSTIPFSTFQQDLPMTMKKTYDPDSCLLELQAKAVQRR
jgi:hypothetical protein